MPVEPRRTKIVATIGPATRSPDKLRDLLHLVDGTRLNFSHGTHEDHAQTAALIRDLRVELERPVALIADLQGPKLRIGDLPNGPVELERGTDVTIAGEDSAVADDLPVAPSVLGSVLQPGNDVLIDDGAVRLRVRRVERGRAECEVIAGGTVSSHKGVNLPGVALPIPSLTRKDIDDLQFALELGCDFVALSFVRTASDVQALKTLIEASGSTAHVIAKIEKAEAVAVLDDVLREADAVMVARGDLGVEIGAAEVPLLQKRIIHRSLERGKPVITATQMLESMIHAPEPTRAEASDVANAILDGTSAIMLSGETAVGDFPLEAVAYMDRIARAVEPHLGYRHEIPAAEETADDRPGDVERGLRRRRGARGPCPARADLHRPDRVGGRPPAPAPADHRPHPPRLCAQPHGNRVGRHARAHPRGTGRRGVVVVVDRGGARDRHRRSRRPARDHRRHRRQHPRLDERDQGGLRRRGGPEASAAESSAVPAARPRKRRRHRLTRERKAMILRAAVVGVAVLVGALYYQPLSNYLETKRNLDTRRAEVQELRDERARLEARLLRSATAAALSREARRLGLVREGERLFIVKGIPEWRRTIHSDG